MEKEEKISKPKEHKRDHIKVLVIDQSPLNNYFKLFNKKTLEDGTPIKVDQCGWENIDLYVQSEKEGGRAVCEIQPSLDPIYGSPQKDPRTFIPDFLIVRNTVTRVKEDYSNILFGFHYANVPSINNLSSIIACMKKPNMTSEMNRLKKLHSKEKFPFIDQMYFANKEVIKDPVYEKCIIKVGDGHAGFGKIKITDNTVYKDTLSIIQLSKDFYTAEPFINYKYDLRIQKIGNHYRGFKRESLIGNWKANVGEAKATDVELEKRHIFYIEEASKIMGGLDICALDVLGDADGNEHILELNDTSIGLSPEHSDEDKVRIVNLAISRMNELFVKKVE